MSQRHAQLPQNSPAPPALDPADGALLDAARACVMAVGMKRTTLTDVARRAGVSRMTVYRRFPDVEALLQALMTREFLSVLGDVVRTDGGNARERLARGAGRGVMALSEHPLFNRLMDVDPELLLPYAFHRYGAFQRAVLSAFGGIIRQGIAEGSIREEDPELLAVALELMLRGPVLAARTEEVTAEREAICAQLVALIDGGLKP
ncbi:MAG: transcriptional regulator, TetR family [Solirubrobacterales bacterium]|nr:transcriptional regulator, TetR family [Solirubrobacterales bacterium]